MVTIKIKRMQEEARIPNYANLGDAGMDLHSIDDYKVHPQNRILVQTGLSIELPLGYEAQVRPRSGLALKHGITILNSPGTIDSGYRGEIGVIIINHGTSEYVIKKGDKIAQLIISKHETPTIEEVLDLSETQRGSGGFGSTGK